MTDQPRDPTDPLAYEYVGGGYFRLKGVPRGQKGNAVHGGEYATLVAARVAALEAKVPPPPGAEYDGPMI